jgi:hypothetical protein
MKNWWLPIFSPRSAARRATTRSRSFPKLEILESREVPTLNVLGSFQGMNQADGGFAEPPDTQMAAGPNSEIEQVNSAVAIFNRSGQRIAFTDAGTFFKVTDSNAIISDPTVTYDEMAGRYILTNLLIDFNNNTSFLMVAVSNNSTPQNLTTDWTVKVNIDTSENQGGTLYWSDYPKIGYNADSYVFSFNMFGFSGGNVHTRVIAIDKASLLAGAPTTFASDPSSNLFTMAGAAMHGSSAGGPMWFASNGGGGSTLTLTEMTGVLTANPTYTDFAVPVNAWTGGPPAVQPDGSTVDSLGDRMMSVAWVNNQLVAAHSVAVNGLPKAAWYEFSTSGSQPTKIQEGLIDPGPTVSTYVPAINIFPSGNIGMTYMETSTSGEFISMYATGRTTTDPAGTMQPSVKIFAGGSIYLGSRQGDYASAVDDPNDGTLWVANEYADGSGGWTTGIGHISLELPPVIDSLTANPSTIFETQSMTLSGTFHDISRPNDAYTILINWNDGSAPTTLTTPAGKHSFSVAHTYLVGKSAPIPIQVTITDQDGNSATGSVSVTVNDLPPTVTITNVPVGSQPDTKPITLNSLVNSASNFHTYTYAWTVTKNGNSFLTNTNQSLTFTPDDKGSYVVNLAVTDDAGGIGVADPVAILVFDAPPSASGLTNNGPVKTGNAATLTVVKPTAASSQVAAGLLFDYSNNSTFSSGGSKWTVLNSLSPTQGTLNLMTAGLYTFYARIHDADLTYSQVYSTTVMVNASGSGNGGTIVTRYVLAGSDASPGITSEIQAFTTAGKLTYTLTPFGVNYTSGYRVAVTDFNGDGVEDFIVAPGPGGGSTVEVLNGANPTSVLASFTPYGANYNSGFYLAGGDFNNDGFGDVVISPDKGAVAEPVVAFDGAGAHPQIFSYFPFGNSYKSGVSIALGDVNGDGFLDLVSGQLTTGSKVQVNLNTGTGLLVTNSIFRTIGSAMPSGYNGGVYVAAGDLNGDGKADVIVGSNTSFGHESVVRAYSGSNNALLYNFIPFTTYTLGVRVAVDDLDGDGKADLLISPAKASTGTLFSNPRVIGLKGSTLTGIFLQTLNDSPFQGGVFVG